MAWSFWGDRELIYLGSGNALWKKWAGGIGWGRLLIEVE